MPKNANYFCDFVCLQKEFNIHSPHFGDLAVQISRPNSTRRWQKSDWIGFSIHASKILSILAGFFSLSG